MTLDNEAQRQQLLEIFDKVAFSGETVEAAAALKRAIREAVVAGETVGED